MANPQKVKALSGKEAWQGLIEALKKAGDMVTGHTGPKSELDIAEG